MKILSINVRMASRDLNPFDKHFWLRRSLELNRLIDAEKPDFVCAQECTFVQAVMILLTGKYRILGKRSKNPIFALRQYKHDKPISVNLPYEEGYHRSANIVTVEGHRICNCHLDWDAEVNKRQTGAIAFYRPDIICGDFNIGDSYIYDTIGELHRIKCFSPTFHKWEKRTDIIDYFYVTDSNEGSVRVVFNDKISDHYPLIYEKNIF